MRGPRGIWLASACLWLAGCTSVVRYADSLVDDRGGRTWFTRLPATLGGTAGFIVGVPIDVAAFAPAWVYYRSLPRDTRDPLSVFLFPSFVLWKVGVLLGAPFDVVEWGAYRAWREAPPLTQQEREAIEREWDSRGWFGEYPVTPLHPAPVPPDGG
jgi:hypothetical protein